MAAMDGPNPALALQLLEQIRGQFPGSRRADRLTVDSIIAPGACACASSLLQTALLSTHPVHKEAAAELQG